MKCRTAAAQPPAPRLNLARLYASSSTLGATSTPRSPACSSCSASHSALARSKPSGSRSAAASRCSVASLRLATWSALRFRFRLRRRPASVQGEGAAGRRDRAVNGRERRQLLRLQQPVRRPREPHCLMTTFLTLPRSRRQLACLWSNLRKLQLGAPDTAPFSSDCLLSSARRGAWSQSSSPLLLRQAQMAMNSRVGTARC